MISGPRQRALLLVLLLSANVPVRREVLVDALWGETPPPDAGHALEALVSRLRRTLAGSGTDASRIIETVPGGYLLRVEEGRLDLERFEHLAAASAAALAAQDFTSAALKSDEALRLWRGTPLEELEDNLLGIAEARRLAELRLTVVEDRIEALIAQGRHTEVVPELQGAILDNPYRERLRAQLMLALYRGGRQTEALEVYREARRTLATEVGLEPSPALKELERAILSHDPALSLRSDDLSSHLRTRRYVVPLLAAALAVATGALALTASRPSQRAEPSGTPRIANGLVSVDPARGETSGSVPLVSRVSAAAAGAGAVWLTDASANLLLRIDSATQTVRDTIPVGEGPSDVAVGAGAVWVVNHLDDTVSRVDPAAAKVVQTIHVGNGPSSVAIAGEVVWVANTLSRSLTMISARSGAIRRTVPTVAPPTSLSLGAGALWVTSAPRNQLLRLDPMTGRLQQVISIGTGPTAVAATPTAVWVLNSLDGTAARVDPKRGAVVALVDAGAAVTDLAAVGDRIWVADASRRQVSEVSGTRTAVRLGARPQALAATADRLFVGVTPAHTSHRGGTLRIVTAEPTIDSIDPAIHYSLMPTQLLALTNDGLLTFRRVAGAEGLQLVPDLATSLPVADPAGMSYTFQLRRGIRYSSGRLVRPADFRYAIERDFRLHSPGAAYFRGIVGAHACEAAPARCRLRDGIVTNKQDNTVTFRLTEADPDFLEKLALSFAYAVPVGTPMRELKTPLPATGPYLIQKLQRGRSLRLVRNPRFREWSAAAQPDGYADAIEWRFDVPLDEAITAVEHGAADWLLTHTSLPVAHRPELLTRFSAHLHTQTQPASLYYFLNTRVPPFNDVRVRRALNLAVDRNRVITALGGRRFAQASCQVLPPRLPGYRRYCPYTLNPDESGRWAAPDLPAARQLVARSGTRGMSVDVVSDVRTRDLVYVAKVLRTLGYRAKVRIIGGGRYGVTVGNSRNRIQIGQGGWVADFPTPSAFIDAKLSCHSFAPASTLNYNDAEFCNPSIEKLILHARRLEATRPEQAYRLWAQIDRAIVRHAPWLFLATPKAVDFVSKRVGNYQFHPLWGILLDQLWLQ